MRAPVLPDDFCNNENITINKKQELSHPPADSFFGEKKKKRTNDTKSLCQCPVAAAGSLSLSPSRESKTQKLAANSIAESPQLCATLS